MAEIFAVTWLEVGGMEFPHRRQQVAGSGTQIRGSRLFESSRIRQDPGQVDSQPAATDSGAHPTAPPPESETPLSLFGSGTGHPPNGGTQQKVHHQDLFGAREDFRTVPSCREGSWVNRRCHGRSCDRNSGVGKTTVLNELQD